MSSEKKYFICRNEQCNPDGSTDGGMVFPYKPPQKGKPFICPYCESEYIEEDDNILYKAIIKKEEIFFNGNMLFQTRVIYEEIVLESGADYKSFIDQYESNHVYFPRLVLKNIKEPDYKGLKFSFNKCRIDELIIEDVDISATHYPILFSDCVIDNVRISNSKIIRTNRNSYKSLWSFFGINFFNTEITKSFSIDRCESSLMISSCQVKCPLVFSKRSKVDLALIHNKNNPEIKADKGSAVTQLFKVAGRSTSASVKEIKTTGTTIRDINIDELHVDPDTEKISILENCAVRKLVFESGSSISGKLLFKNCFIESIQHTPYCFEQDLVFQGCTINDELLLTRSNFNQSLIFEFCSFEENAIFNDLKIEDDFQLSYSTFKKGLFFSGNKCGNYFKCHINTIQGEINFEDNVVVRDANFRAIRSNSKIAMYHNEIAGYLFLRQINIKGELGINMLYADALTINNTSIEGSFIFTNSSFKNDLSIRRIKIKGVTNFTDNLFGGRISLDRSSFANIFQAISLKSRINSFVNIDFKTDCTFNSCTFSQQAFTSRNIYGGKFNWDIMDTHNISFSANYLQEGLAINTAEAKDISINKNVSLQGIEINNSKANDITLNDNLIHEHLKIINTHTDDIFIEQNEVHNELVLNYTISNDLIFKGNTTNFLKLFKSSFTEVILSECKEIGDTEMSRLSVSRSFTISDNIFLKEIYLSLCNIKRALVIEHNKAENFTLIKSETGFVHYFRNYLSANMLIDESKTENIIIHESQLLAELKLSNLKSKKIEIDNNYIFGSLFLNIVKADDIYFETIGSVDFIQYFS